MTPEQITAWTGVGTMIGLIIVGVLNRLDARKAKQLAETTSKIHVLVNSNFGIQLRVNWLQARRIADMTKLPADIELESEAKRLYEEHELKQAKVDSEIAQKPI